MLSFSPLAVAAVVQSSDWDAACAKYDLDAHPERRTQIAAAFEEPSPDDRMLAVERASKTIYKGGKEGVDAANAGASWPSTRPKPISDQCQ